MHTPVHASLLASPNKAGQTERKPEVAKKTKRIKVLKSFDMRACQSACIFFCP